MIPTKDHAIKILHLLSYGLIRGVGQPKPGQMCIMAVFNYVLGRPHGDSGLEDCVGAAVRAYDIALNDSLWSSNKARAEGMKRESIAKLGSNQVGQVAFHRELALLTIQRIVPVALRAAASCHPIPIHREALELNAKNCEGVTTLAEAKKVIAISKDAAFGATAANAYAANAYANAYADARKAAWERLADGMVECLARVPTPEAEGAR